MGPRERAHRQCVWNDFFDNTLSPLISSSAERARVQEVARDWDFQNDVSAAEHFAMLADKNKDGQIDAEELAAFLKDLERRDERLRKKSAEELAGGRTLGGRKVSPRSKQCTPLHSSAISIFCQ